MTDLILVGLILVGFVGLLGLIKAFEWL